MKVPLNGIFGWLETLLDLRLIKDFEKWLDSFKARHNLRMIYVRVE